MSKRTQKRFRWRKSHSKVDTNDEFYRAKQWKGSISAIFYCIRKPGENPDMKVKVLWVRKLRSTLERGDPLFAQKERTDLLYTHTHQATQNGMLIKLGLVKIANLMNWWMIERWDPPCARKIWILTTILILLRRLQSRIDALAESKQRVCPFYRDLLLLLPKWRSCMYERNVSETLAESKQRVIECERFKTNPQKMQQKTAKNILWCGDFFFVFNIASICIHDEELLRQFAFHQNYRRSHHETDVRHMWEIGIRTIRGDLWNKYN